MFERFPRLVLLAMLLVSALLLANLAPAALAAPPTGFTDTLVAGVPSPTALAFIPDGRMLVTMQTGQVRVFSEWRTTRDSARSACAQPGLRQSRARAA